MYDHMYAHTYMYAYMYSISRYCEITSQTCEVIKCY